MRPRKADGTWKAPFNPSALAHSESVGGDYTEGNAWQYTWHVQHDVPGLIQLFGGEKPFLNKLDSLFTVKLEGESLADVTGLIGYSGIFTVFTGSGCKLLIKHFSE